jgi:hypothetical protein
MENKLKKRGGPRPGSGRPKGSKPMPKFLSYVGTKDIDGLVNKAMKLADNGDSSMIKFLLDQVFGRAHQNIGLGNIDGQPLKIEVSEAIAEKRNLK